MNGTILVLGATGTVGRPLCAELARAGTRVRAATRSPARADFPGNVEVAPFDLERPETFGPALEGVDRVFLIARPGDDHADRLAFPLIDALERQGVCQVVDLSAMGADLRPMFALRRIEQRLEGSALAWTHLRPNWFMQLFTGGALLGALRTGHLRLPAARARISWIDARDVAAVATATLLAPHEHARKAYTLTGPEPLDHADVAALIAAASGAPLNYQPIDEDQARHLLGGAGFPPAWVERLIGFYGLVREGLAAPVSAAVPDLLGRPARTFTSFARENARTWQR